MTKGAKDTTPRRFVLLPPRGLQAADVGESKGLGPFLVAIDTAFRAAGAKKAMVKAAPGARIEVLDSIHENGAKLVEMTLEQVVELRAAQPGLRIVPEVFYKPALFQPTIESRLKAKGVALATKIVLKVVSRADGSPLKGVKVVAFTDFAAREGAMGTSNASGSVSLALGAASKKVERLYAFALLGFWGALRRNITVKSGTVLEMEPIDLASVDCVRHFYGSAAPNVGSGVTVGVIDSGVDTAHPDLVVDGGLNTVVGEAPADFGDNGGHHGTHVAGIIAARGTAPTGIRGVAPGVRLRSYRVFGKNAEGASNFAIAKAIDAAVSDGCDIVNLSLGGGDADDATRSAIADARAAGVLAIAAAGNDDRGPVSFPASDPRAVAVSALGRKGTFPAGTEPEGDVAAPFGSAADDFVAAFSNVGPEIDLIGPGVGVISTVPGGHAIMSGTSMACPAVAGIAARLLAAHPAVLAMPRDQARSDEIAKLLLQSARDLGFGVTFQGKGLPG
jgi:subtilisin